MSDNPTTFFSFTGAADPHLIRRRMSDLPAIERDLDEIEARNKQTATSEWLKPIRPSATLDRAEIERRLGRSR